MNELESLLNYLETTSLEPHDDYTSEFSYKEQKKLWRYIKGLQQENQELKQDIKNLVNIINHNCLELETTKDQFESLKRWNK